MRTKFLALILLGWFLLGVQAPGGFLLTAELEDTPEGLAVRLSMQMAPDHYLYADQFRVKGVDGTALSVLEPPETVEKDDPFMGEVVKVISKSFEALYRVESHGPGGVAVEASWQGCDQVMCYMPQRETFRFAVEGAPAEVPAEPAPVAAASAVADEDEDWPALAARFRIAASASGFMGVEPFLAFLSEAQAGGGRSGMDLENRHLVPALLIILLGGLLLNLTPCVLPMLPINLAIIGAGAKASSRGRGFLMGGLYGLGMALTYGVLGLVVVLTNAAFGELNASPWFNGAMTALFLLMALAMFDVIHVDLSRFQRAGGAGRRTGGLLALGMGVVSALLAGACVAPVVIAVLLWAGNLYARGAIWGLFLPFVLGIGMALPWPIAGAGLSFLPKPGRWMVAVRNGFGVLILLLAVYYGSLTYQLSGFRFGGPGPDGVALHDARLENAKLREQLEKALREGRPVFMDFTASWCKNCQAMETATFRDEAVIRALEPFVFIAYHAEQPADPLTRAVLDYFHVLGLPTSVVLDPL